MSKLYHEWASIYDALYAKLFDYEAEHAYYSQFLHQHACRSLIEYGCGTGRLAARLVRSGYDYTGVDLSEAMIELARRRNPQVSFLEGDLQTFTVNEAVDAALITGRTLSYLTTNEQVLTAFRTIYRNLKPGGMLIFDAIDATSLFSNFKEEYELIEVPTERGLIRRISQNKPLLTTGWTWEWQASYQLQGPDNDRQLLGTDLSTLRAFIKEELMLLLTLSGFELTSTYIKPAYTWPSPYYVAHRKD